MFSIVVSVGDSNIISESKLTSMKRKRDSIREISISSSSREKEPPRNQYLNDHKPFNTKSSKCKYESKVSKSYNKNMHSKQVIYSSSSESDMEEKIKNKISTPQPKSKTEIQSEDAQARFYDPGLKLDLTKFTAVPSLEVEDINTLLSEFPLLSKKGTEVIFRIYELCNDTNSPQISDFKYGKIQWFNKETKSLLIKAHENCSNIENMQFLFNSNSLVLNVPLKDIIELRIYTGANNGSVHLNDPVLATAKRQIEFYFGDCVYEQNTFLVSKEDEEKCKLI